MLPEIPHLRSHAVLGWEWQCCYCAHRTFSSYTSTWFSYGETVVLGYVCMQSNALSIDYKIKISACSQKHWRCSTSCSIQASLNSSHKNIITFICESANLLSNLINSAYMCLRILLKQISQLCTISKGLIHISISYTHILKATQKNSQVKMDHEWQSVRSSHLTKELGLWWVIHTRAHPGVRTGSIKPDWHTRLFFS